MIKRNLSLDREGIRGVFSGNHHLIMTGRVRVNHLPKIPKEESNG